MKLNKITSLILGIVIVLTMFTVPILAEDETTVLINKTLPAEGKLIDPGVTESYTHTYDTGAQLVIERDASLYTGGSSTTSYGTHLQYDGVSGYTAPISYMVNAGSGVSVSNSTLTLDVDVQQIDNAQGNFWIDFYVGNKTTRESVVALGNVVYFTYGAASIHAVADNKGTSSTVTVTVTYYTNEEKTATDTQTVTKECAYVVSEMGPGTRVYGGRRTQIKDFVLTKTDKATGGGEDDGGDSSEIIPEELEVGVRKVLIDKNGPAPAVHLPSGGTEETYTHTYDTGAKLLITRGAGYGGSTTGTATVDSFMAGETQIFRYQAGTGGWNSGVDFVASAGNIDVSNAKLDISFDVQQIDGSDFHLWFKVGNQYGLYSALELTNVAYFAGGAATVKADIENKNGKSQVDITLTYYTNAEKTETATVTETKTYDGIIDRGAVYVDGYNNRRTYVSNIVLGAMGLEEEAIDVTLPDDTEDEGDYIYKPEEVLVNNTLPVADISASQWLIAGSAMPNTYSYTYFSGAKFNIIRKAETGARGVLLDSGKIHYVNRDWDGLGTVSTMSAGDNVDVTNSKLTFDFEIDHTTRGNADYRTRVVVGDNADAENVVGYINQSTLYYAYGPAKVSVTAENRSGKSNVSVLITYYTNAELTETETATMNASYNFTVTHLGFVAEHYGRGFELINTSFKKQDSYLKYNPIVDKFPSGGGTDGTLIETDETVTDSEGKAFIKVSAFNNTGTQPATWNKYDGEKLYLLTPNYDYKGDAKISFGWAKGTKDIKYVEFTLSQINRADNLQISATRQSTQGEVLGNIAFIWYKGNANGFIVETAPAGKSYNVRIESDPRTGKVYTYINGILAGETSGELIKDDEVLNVTVVSAGGQIVQIENVSVGTAELSGGAISDITLSEDGKSAYVKTLNPVYHGVGCLDKDIRLFVAGYENEVLSSVKVNGGIPKRGRRTLTAELDGDAQLTNTKAMLWSIADVSGVKDMKEWKNVTE